MDQHHVPSRNEPDPENQRLRPFQGGTDGLVDATAPPVRYGDMKYRDGDGPGADVAIHGGGAGSGLSGTAQADAGNTPAQFANPKAPTGSTE